MRGCMRFASVTYLTVRSLDEICLTLNSSHDGQWTKKKKCQVNVVIAGVVSDDIE